MGENLGTLTFSVEKKPQLPWEKPRIAMILSIFNGRVSSINTVSKEVKLQVGGDKDEVQR